MKMPNLFLTIFSTIFLSIGITGTTQAMQIKESISDGEIDAFIAADELSRIKVIADRIKSVKSNDGEIEIVEDTNLGELYIRPIRHNLEPINIFISTEKNHIYKLLLLPKKMPSEQIFIKNLEAVINEVKTESVALNREEAVIALIRAMRDSNTTYDKISVSPKLKVNEHELVKRFVLLGQELRGEAAEYINKTKLPIVITREMFQERGIVALSADTEVLEPNESTNIYIVREVPHE